VRFAYGGLCMLLYLPLWFRLRRRAWSAASQASAPVLLEGAPS